MAKSEEGEFELVLGNKQLISVFLVVVILLGVFFSMGYIVGRSTSSSGAADAARTGGGKAIVVERPGQPSTPPDSATPPAEQPKPVETTATEKPSPAPPKESAKESKPPATPPPAPAAAPAASSASDPAPGEYWQVVATTRPDAEIVMQALTKKGFHAVIAPVPNDTRFRVLVGPLANAAIQAQTRTDLEASGFKNPVRKKY